MKTRRTWNSWKSRSSKLRRVGSEAAGTWKHERSHERERAGGERSRKELRVEENWPLICSTRNVCWTSEEVLSSSMKIYGWGIFAREETGVPRLCRGIVWIVGVDSMAELTGANSSRWDPNQIHLLWCLSNWVSSWTQSPSSRSNNSVVGRVTSLLLNNSRFSVTSHYIGDSTLSDWWQWQRHRGGEGRRQQASVRWRRTYRVHTGWDEWRLRDWVNQQSNPRLDFLCVRLLVAVSWFAGIHSVLMRLWVRLSFAYWALSLTAVIGSGFTAGCISNRLYYRWFTEFARAFSLLIGI